MQSTAPSLESVESVAGTRRRLHDEAVVLAFDADRRHLREISFVLDVEGRGSDQLSTVPLLSSTRNLVIIVLD